MSVKQELINAKALITNPENWTQGCLSRNAEGLSVYFGTTTACKFCAIGALDKVGPAMTVI